MKKSMKKRWSRFAAAGMAAVMAAGLTAGCGKKATPDNLLEDMQKNMEKKESVQCNVNMEFEAEVDGESLFIGMDLDMGITEAPYAVHGKGKVDMDISGMDLGTELEIYQVIEDGEYTTYTLMDGMWSRSAEADDTGSLNMDVTGDIADYADLFEMSSYNTEVNGKECFEMRGDIAGAALSELFDDDTVSSLFGVYLQEEDMESAKIPCTVSIYRDGILPARITIDLQDIAGTLAATTLGTAEISRCSLEITYMGFDEVDEIEVPEEALEAAQDGVLNDFEGYEDDDDTDESGDDSAETGAGADSDLTGSWDTYTIRVNGTTLTFPCSIDDLESAGLKMDTEYTPEDYVVNSEEYELAWFEDDDGGTIMAEMINMDTKAKEIKDCMVGGISVYDYDIEESSLSIVFPGGITIGSHKDEVLEAYGQPDDSYEGDYANSYYWYDPDGSYYNCCSIDIDPDTGVVTAMNISHYE